MEQTAKNCKKNRKLFSFPPAAPVERAAVPNIAPDGDNVFYRLKTP